MKLVSVIMPAYKVGPFIKQAIESVLNQTYSEIELLISDDPSPDDTRKVIDSFTDPRIRVFHNEKKLGFIGTLNLLLAETKGAYITGQDADDYAEPKRIELLVNELDNDPELGLCGCNYIHIDENGNTIHTTNYALTHSEIYGSMPDSFPFAPSALLMRREVYEKIGGYHPFFEGMGQEDHYWAFRAMTEFKVKNIPDILYHYRFNSNSIMGNLSNNPDKLHSQQIVKLLINQRKETGTDLLEQKKDHELRAILDEMNKPFTEDPSYFFSFVAKRRFYEGKRKLAIKNMWLAIGKKPLKLQYYKDLLYFFRIILKEKLR